MAADRAPDLLDLENFWGFAHMALHPARR